MSEYHNPKKPDDDVLQTILDEFECDFATGDLTRFYKNEFQYRSVGSDTGTALVLKVNRKQLYVHHVIWYLYCGTWPSRLIDHIDTNYQNNAINNLRESNTAVNQYNKYKTSGLPVGVHIRKDRTSKIYQAQIYYSNKKHHLGFYSTPEEAHEAYKTRYKRVYGVDFDA